MNYQAAQSFSGNTGAAFDAVEATLLPNGFKLEGRSERSVGFSGGRMRSTKENPLRGATRIDIVAKGGKLQLEAELGGVRFMLLFVGVFPVVLFAGITAINAIATGERYLELLGHLYPAFLFWVVFAPAMGYWIRKRTLGALDVLLANAVTKGKGTG